MLGRIHAVPGSLARSRWTVSLGPVRTLRTTHFCHSSVPPSDPPTYGSPILRSLSERGFIAALTNGPLDARLSLDKPGSVYLGIDPTASSLHVGNLLAIMGLLHFQRNGHRTTALVGGATGFIGDPSGRSSERTALDPDQLRNNVSTISKQLNAIFDNSRKALGADRSSLPDITVTNNLDWTAPLSIIDFLSSVGKYMRIGPMMMRESVKARINSDQGLSFTEFSYQLLQAMDFWYLYNFRNCFIQIGGSDQWGNITAGIELIHKMDPKAVSGLVEKLKERGPLVEPSPDPKSEPIGPDTSGREAYGITFPLLTTPTGEKFGKSAGNAVWLDSQMTTVYDFYQFFVRTPDSEVAKYLRLFTFIPLAEIDRIITTHNANPELRHAQTILANQVTQLIHGATGLRNAQIATRLLFGEPLDLATLNVQDVHDAFVGDRGRFFALSDAELQSMTLPDLA
ncbi:tyrosyl-tRNA synthetase, partial [Dimargaris cristalligena]